MTAPPQDSIGFVINDVARMMRREFDRQATDLGLTRAQWQVLAHLLREDGQQQKQLADRLDLTAITLTGLLDRLERDGWVERRNDPSDRRAKRVYLTDKVQPTIQAVRRIGTGVRRRALEGLSEEEQDQLMRLLQHMRGNLCSR